MRRPKPYFKKSHHAWYYNDAAGRPQRLATEEEGEKAAWNKYDKVMAGKQPVTDTTPILDLAQRFLDHHKANSSADTLKFYYRPLDSFTEFHPKLLICDLKPHHVTQWLDSRATAKRAKKVGEKYVAEDTGRSIGKNYKRNLLRAVKACFKWCEDEGLIEQSPLRKIKVGATAPRGNDAYLAPEQWAKLMALIGKSRDGGALMDIITIMRESGCRPQEIRRVEARHFDRINRCWVLSAEEAKGKREERVIHLSDKAFNICQRLALKYPEGPLFRNSDGTPWKTEALDYRLYRLSEKLGFRVTPYSVRHTFCTDALTAGVDIQTLATIMGHHDLKMISQVYQHLGRRSAHLKEALRKAVS